MRCSTEASSTHRLTPAQALCRTLPPILAYRLATRVFLRDRLQTPSEFTTRTISGALYHHHRGDLLADQVRMCGFWDWRILAIAAIASGRGGAVIEIGANTGTETVSLADVVGPNGRVYAFEPEPAIFKILSANVRLNGFENVELFALALADRSGSVRFLPPASPRNSGQGFITSDAELGTEGIEVAAVTLDSFAERIGAAGLVVIDVEGQEASVVRGASAYLARYRPTMIVEAVSEQLTRAGSSLAALTTEIEARGYDLFEIRRISVVRFDLITHGSDRYHRNLMCVPRERAADAARVNAMLRACAFLPGFARINPLRRFRNYGRLRR